MKDFLIEDICLQGVDSGDRFNFKCKYCFKNLSSRQNLREHMNIHTGLKPYVCKEQGCGLSFRQGSLLSTHKKSHKLPHIEKRLGVDEDLKPCYPKLTQLIKNDSGLFESKFEKIERLEIMNKIGEEQFRFVERIVDEIFKSS